MDAQVFEVLTQLQWKDVLAWADAPIIFLILLASYVLQPILDPDRGNYKPWQDFFRGDRILLFPLAIGLIFAIALECTTEAFNVNVAIRRILTNSLGSAFLFQYVKRRPVEPSKPVD